MNKKFFNMVEITLAIAVVGIGICGIMSLFPVGIQASKAAIAHNYAADAADVFISYIRRATDKDWAIIGTLNTTKPAGSSSNTSGWSQLEGCVYDPGTSVPGHYAVMLKTGTGSKEFIDFAADIKIWKSPIQASVYDGSSWHSWTDSGYSAGAALNVEMTWPVGKPYDKRSKRYYYVETFKQ